MDRMLQRLSIALLAMLSMACPNPITPTPEPIASTIVFADGSTVSRMLGSGPYANAVSGTGDGILSFASGAPDVAAVDAGSGAVSILAAGSAVITASKAATATHAAASGSYTLTVTPISVAFSSLARNDGASGTSATTSLTLTFTADPVTLTAEDITVTGATKGDLTGSGPTRNLQITGITVPNGRTVSVSLANPRGYDISGSPRTAVVYRDSWGVGGIGPAGGFVFFDKGSYSSGWRYLEASPSDNSAAIVWWNGANLNIGGAKGTDVGTGKANTAAIVAIQGTGLSYAAKLCDELTLSGYSDWFLPSRDELNLMYQNLHLQGLGGFVTTAYSYWSSSQTTPVNPYTQGFNNGSQTTTNPSYSRRVRAARSF